jgi:hypothetical protein
VQCYHPYIGVTSPSVSRCTYSIFHRYHKLEILDLNWKNSETFVDFVQSHIRSYHAKGFSHKKLSYRSSNVKELFKLLYHTPKPERLLELVPNDPVPSVREATPYAIWSLTFGIAQVDAKDDFVRTFKFLQPPLPLQKEEQQAQRQPLSCLKCAESIVEVMRLMFPLPVALFSYLTNSNEQTKEMKVALLSYLTGKGKRKKDNEQSKEMKVALLSDLTGMGKRKKDNEQSKEMRFALLSDLTGKNEEGIMEKDIKSLSESVSPFCIWSMHPCVEANTDSFEIMVHISGSEEGSEEAKKEENKKENGAEDSEEAKKEENKKENGAEDSEEAKKEEKKKENRAIKCVFKGLHNINIFELQNVINNCLHKEFGIVSIALARFPHFVEEQAGKIESVFHVKTQASKSEPDDAEGVVDSPKFMRLFNAISGSCLQSTKVLVDFCNTPSEIMPEVFILKQTLDVFGMYKELVADFFMDLKGELQQRIHGEDKDGVCKTAYERISRSPAVSLPLYFFELGRMAQQRLIQSIPDDFLQCKPLNSNSRCSFLCFSSKNANQDFNAVKRYEHDYDFPIPTSLGSEVQSCQENWTRYFEYLYLNCNDDRPYAPCWDPIALQEKAAAVEKALGLGEPLSDKEFLVTNFFFKFRQRIMNDVMSFWPKIQREKHYSKHDSVVLMNRLQLAIKKVFYFAFCCKRIVLCEKCCEDFGLDVLSKQKDPEVRTSIALKCSNYSLCGFSNNHNDEGKLYSYVPKFSLQRFIPHLKGKKLENLKKKSKGIDNFYTDDMCAKILRKRHSDLKTFCFGWLIEVAFNLKKSCVFVSSFLRHQFATVSMKHVHSMDLSRKVQGSEESKHNDERSRLFGLLSDTVELCKSGRLIPINSCNSAIKDIEVRNQIMCIIVTAEVTNKVVTECDLLKTGCSAYERFPNLGNNLSVNRTEFFCTPSRVSQLSKSEKRKSLKIVPQTKEKGTMTHLIIAAIEGNARKACQYICRADLDYIFHDYIDDNFLDSRRCGDFQVGSCALHMALERGHTDVAIKIIDRVYSLAREEVFEYFQERDMAKEAFLNHLFLGAFSVYDESATGGQVFLEIPTVFMYLARYSMISEMNRFMEILQRLRNLEECRKDIRKYIIEPTDSNGLNALHYAVLSQSPSSVSWFVPFMQEFRVCQSSSKLTFIPELMPRDLNDKHNVVVMTICQSHERLISFEFGYSQFLRMHPPVNFSDSDRRLSVCEDWIQTYHFSIDRRADLITSSTASVVQSESDRMHLNISPYELALLVWRLLDVESSFSQEVMHNLATNTPDDKKKGKNSEEENGSTNGVCSNFFLRLNRLYPEASKPVISNDSAYEDEEDENLQHELFAESYKDRSSRLYTILSDLEVAANQEVGIDSKKKKGLKELLNYRSHRAVSRMVFPGLSYLLYVFFATLMAILMTNGLFDEPTKFTHAVVNELGWENPQRAINAIASFSDLTTWWGVLAGFLWESSPMARPFGEKIARWAIFYICMH